MAQKILVIEDEESILYLLRRYLHKADYVVITATDGLEGLELHAREQPDLVILDLMLPQIDGFDVCQRIRAWSETPILMLTARSSEEDRIAGFDIGADDYLVKPFSPREVVSRVHAILRRTNQLSLVPAVVPASPTILRFPDLMIDLSARRVEVNALEVALTPFEFDLLATLAQHCGRVCTREMLMKIVWGSDYLGESRLMDVHISCLRKKIEVLPGQHYIKTVWRVGYRFEASIR